MAKERNCIFCGKSYQYCPNCGEYNSLPKWMFNFDTEKCHDLYEVMGAYNIGKKTKEDIRQVLIEHNITDYSQFSQKLQNKLNSLFSSTSKVEELKKVEKEITNEDVPVIDENISTAESTIVEENQEELVQPRADYKSRRTRRYNKKNTEEANTEE